MASSSKEYFAVFAVFPEGGRDIAQSQLRVLAQQVGDRMLESVKIANTCVKGSPESPFPPWLSPWMMYCDDAKLLDEFPRFCSFKASYTLAVDLPGAGPLWPLSPSEEVHNPHDGKVIPRGDKVAWKSALQAYGPGGQQDGPKGRAPWDELFGLGEPVWSKTIVHDKRLHTPHCMSAIWYGSQHFKDVYASLAAKADEERGKALMLPTSLSEWEAIAVRLTRNLHRIMHVKKPFHLSSDSIPLCAGELASTALLIAVFPNRFCDLVDQIYEDGRNARWTFGWSGLLSCFSKLWTLERVYIAALNGLSLLALKSASSIEEIHPSVRAMLVGYTSFVVSDRAVGKRISRKQKKELKRRYRLNKGSTCRGSGVNATRQACRVLGIPAEASFMDGLPAFATGWAMEFLEAKPGCQKAEHGATHDEIEQMHGGSRFWRYPDAGD